MAEAEAGDGEAIFCLASCSNLACNSFKLSLLEFFFFSLDEHGSEVFNFFDDPDELFPDSDPLSFFFG